MSNIIIVLQYEECEMQGMIVHFLKLNHYDINNKVTLNIEEMDGTKTGVTFNTGFLLLAISNEMQLSGPLYLKKLFPNMHY